MHNLGMGTQRHGKAAIVVARGATLELSNFITIVLFISVGFMEFLIMDVYSLSLLSCVWSFCPPRISLKTRILLCLIIKEIYHFNPSVDHKIKTMIDSLNMQGPYIGFHIRGGDKQFEHQLLPVDQYISRAERLSDIRQGFVSTDDYRNFELLCQKYPKWKFYTLTPPANQGYDQYTFTTLTPQQRFNELIIMFASMEAMCHSELTICTFSSNIGMYLGMRIGNRAVGIDMDKWMIW